MISPYNFFLKGPRDNFEVIDTFYGALAQFLHIFLGQKQEKCDLKKNGFS
jgi:hypothetical protein